MTQRIVVLGGGTGGTLLANRLARRFGEQTQITVIDRDDTHIYPGVAPSDPLHEKSPRLPGPFP